MVTLTVEVTYEQYTAIEALYAADVDSVCVPAERWLGALLGVGVGVRAASLGLAIADRMQGKPSGPAAAPLGARGRTGWRNGAA